MWRGRLLVLLAAACSTKAKPPEPTSTTSAPGSAFVARVGPKPRVVFAASLADPALEAQLADAAVLLPLVGGGAFK